MKKKVHLIPDFNNIEKSMELADRYDAAFEYNDFFVPSLIVDDKALRERIHFYKSLGRDTKADTLHGVFYDITVHSSDPAIRRISEERIRGSIETALELGAHGVVFHTNYITNFKSKFYMDSWVDLNAVFWEKMLSEYDIDIYIENMFDEEPDLLVRLMEVLGAREKFGICFDFAHANAFGHDLRAWEDAVAPYIKHMHINDNDLKVDLHQTMGEGKIDWQEFNRFIAEKQIDSSVLIEVSDILSQRKSLEYMVKNHIYPFD